jgi:hypothetical protein
MKCNKCGSVNPEGTLFCEECDHRLDQPYVHEKKFSRKYFVYVGVVLGLISVVLWYLEVWIGSIMTGGAGMMLGAYSMTFAKLVADKNKPMMYVLAGIAICTSVIGFMFGITGLSG